MFTTRLFVHPRGTYIAILEDQRLRVYDASGALRWQIAAPLAQRIAWLGDELVVDYVGGLGKIDVATGALIGRTPLISPQQSTTATYILEPGGYVLLCNISVGPNSHARDGQRQPPRVSGTDGLDGRLRRRAR